MLFYEYLFDTATSTVIQRSVSEIINPNAAFADLNINHFKYSPSNSMSAVAPSNFAYMRLGADTLSICDSLSVITKRNGKQNQNVLVVFPNPATNKLNLVFDKNSTGTVAIFDAMGKEVNSYIINNPSSELPIDISNFTNGVYYVSYRNKDVSIHRKFVKQ